MFSIIVKWISEDKKCIAESSNEFQKAVQTKKFIAENAIYIFK